MDCGLMRRWIAFPVFLAVSLFATRTTPEVGVRPQASPGSPRFFENRSRLVGSDAELRSTPSSLGDDKSPDIQQQVDFPDRIGRILESSWDPDGTEVERTMLLRRWAETDPISMTSWVLEHLVGQERIQALKQAVVVWAGKDLDAALRWVEALPGDEGRNSILVELGFEAARMDPTKAVRLAAQMPESTSRDELLVHAVRQWASVDASAAGKWAAALPESQLRQEILSAVAVSISSEDGRYAAGLVADAMVAGKAQVDASILVARKWGSQYPEEAAEWIARFPDAAVRQQALRGLVAGWSIRSSESMLAWVGTLSDSALRDEALAAIGSLPRRSLESEESFLEVPGP